MNIFYLDESPVVAAKVQYNKHVVKMILESAQMLCAIHPQGDAPYRRAYYNHPCTVWTRESKDNYSWLINHAYALCEEYTRRYSRQHKSEEVIRWCDKNQLDLPETGLTPHTTCMPDKYKVDCPVQSYRNYYNGEKASFAKWKNSPTPDWFVPV